MFIVPCFGGRLVAGAMVMGAEKELPIPMKQGTSVPQSGLALISSMAARSDPSPKSLAVVTGIECPAMTSNTIVLTMPRSRAESVAVAERWPPAVSVATKVKKTPVKSSAPNSSTLQLAERCAANA